MKYVNKVIGFSLIGMLLSTSAFSQETDKLIWGGGDVKTSTYSNVYVPRVQEVLAQNRMAGYAWGGVSEGTLFNAQKVSENPANLALGQWDLLKDLNGQPIPGTPGATYKFTVLAKDIGPECLYMVTDQPGYTTFGDVLGNAWDMTIATGGELSGSYGTLKHLQSIYPDLNDATIVTAGGANDIVAKVAGDDNITHGFFVMRPDPASDTFKKIQDLKLSLIPIVDYDIENEYTFQDLKVAYGGLFGSDQFLTTACTSVALITGDPAAVDPSNTRLKRRVDETIKRIQAVNPEDLKPNLSTWQDMWSSMKSAAASKTTELMDASKKALDDAVKSRS